MSNINGVGGSYVIPQWSPSTQAEQPVTNDAVPQAESEMDTRAELKELFENSGLQDTVNQAASFLDRILGDIFPTTDAFGNEIPSYLDVEDSWNPFAKVFDKAFAPITHHLQIINEELAERRELMEQYYPDTPDFRDYRDYSDYRTYRD